MNLIELQKRNLRALIRTGAFQFINEETPWFYYTSGQIGPYYIQSVNIEKDGEAYAEAIESMKTILRQQEWQFDVISGGETRDWDFSNPVAVLMRKPHVKLYKNGKLLGADLYGKTVLHVADLNNEGSSIRDYWKPMIEKAGGTLVGFCSFVDRLEEGTTVLANLKIPSMSLVSLNEKAWELMMHSGEISPQLFRILKERIKDKEKWARKTLLENKTFLCSFAKEPASKEKLKKILITYSDIKAELVKILKEGNTEICE
jgi:orotate phosphoribosyltransferase